MIRQHGVYLARIALLQFIAQLCTFMLLSGFVQIKGLDMVGFHLKACL